MTAARPRRTKPDRNQRRLVHELRELGMVVWNTSHIGGEVLDLVCAWRGRVLPVEVKAPGHEGDLTPGEAQAIIDLARVGVTAIVATCAEGVVAAWDALEGEL